MVPAAAVDAEPSKDVADPGAAGVTVKEAVGAGSGSMSIPPGPTNPGRAVPAVLVATVTGTTVVPVPDVPYTLT
jgi:hypothetical protein